MADMPHWFDQALAVLIVIVPYLIWILFCLFAINWKKMRPTLSEGAWVPLLLLIILAALVWSQVHATDVILFGVITVPNFWWQLMAAGSLAALGLFAGWVQERYHWTPLEVELAPVSHAHGHDHGHGHDHDADSHAPRSRAR